MKIGMRFIVRLFGATLMLAAITSTARQPAAPSPADSDSAVVRIAPEVRLRKLHLVRPDLIPYPVAYEVYC